jgi:hypothetical protein
VNRLAQDPPISLHRSTQDVAVINRTAGRWRGAEQVNHVGFACWSLGCLALSDAMLAHQALMFTKFEQQVKKIFLRFFAIFPQLPSDGIRWNLSRGKGLEPGLAPARSGGFRLSAHGLRHALVEVPMDHLVSCIRVSRQDRAHIAGPSDEDLDGFDQRLRPPTQQALGCKSTGWIVWVVAL